MLINRFVIVGTEMYYCNMDAGLTKVKSCHVILEDNSQYRYTINQAEITNLLGTVITYLDEYFITGQNGETYKLYRTKEGNWYDIPETISIRNTGIIQALKSAIDNNETGPKTSEIKV